MKAVAYIRLSDEDQSNYSIDSQERHIKEYCNRNGLELLNIYKDNGQSSYTFDRKAFGVLEKEIKQAQYLIVYHLDRFSRNMAEAMIKIKQYLERGIRVRDVSEPLDMDDYSDNTFMMRSMRFMVAESELRRIRERTRNGMHQAAINGRWLGTAPTGYKNARDAQNKPIILIDEEKAAIIRIIFREYLNGMSIEDLRRMVKLYGFPLTGNSAIQRVLANPVYAGYIKVKATKNKPAHLVKGIHDAIVSTEDYWLSQERLQGKTIIVQNRNEVPLRGALSCGCGQRFTAGNSKGRTKYYWYYVCRHCSLNLSATKLHDQFNEILDNLSFDMKAFTMYKEKMVAKINEFLATRDNKIKEVEKQLKLVEGKISSVEEKYLLKPEISEATFNKVITELRADQSRLYKELSRLNTTHAAGWAKLDIVLKQFTDIRAKFDSLPIEKKHQFINLVFDSSLSYENGTYRTPFLHPIFSHNLKKLKEKGLLIIVAPIKQLGEIPISTRDGNAIEPGNSLLTDLELFMKILVA
jgi:site-specific DNA recombinase